MLLNDSLKRTLQFRQFYSKIGINKGVININRNCVCEWTTMICVLNQLRTKYILSIIDIRKYIFQIILKCVECLSITRNI